MTTDLDLRMMDAALAQARQAFERGEVPIGAVVECGGRIVGTGHNLTEALNDVTAHAEMIAITAAANTLGGKFLDQCTLYVTVEPCLMCAGAIGWSRLRRVVVGTPDPKRGYTTFTSASPFHPRTVIETGVRADQCRSLMQEFFKARR